MFAWTNRRCKQLSPITDQVLYHNKPKSDLAVEGYCMYQKFETVVKLQVNERAKENDVEQENFRQLQMSKKSS